LEDFFLSEGRSLTILCEALIALGYLWNGFIFGPEMFKTGDYMAKHELVVIAGLRVKLIPSPGKIVLVRTPQGEIQRN
jgi:hypothetical protein